MYLLISSNSCVLSLGVFMAMDSTAPWNNRYTCSGSNSYHIRAKYVLTDDLCICSFISLCMYIYASAHDESHLEHKEVFGLDEDA